MMIRPVIIELDYLMSVRLLQRSLPYVRPNYLSCEVEKPPAHIHVDRMFDFMAKHYTTTLSDYSLTYVFYLFI